ncbi:MAG: YidB family protein [Xanthomonadales bacterium]|jgi:uncharacterized protein YidB (DUF937 family)|nr:YidB family protein [Xanthomonadales bacterium]
MHTQTSSQITPYLRLALNGEEKAVERAAVALTQDYGGREGLKRWLVEQGLGELLTAWDCGQKRTLQPRQLDALIGRDYLATLAQLCGLSMAQTLAGLSDCLPCLVREELLAA